VARPGEGGYATAAARGDPFGEDPDDRIVERVPRYSEQDGAGFDSSRQGDIGFGDQALGGPFGSPPQSPGFSPPQSPGFGPPRSPGFSPPLGNSVQGPGFGPVQGPGFSGPPLGNSAFGGPVTRGPFGGLGAVTQGSPGFGRPNADPAQDRPEPGYPEPGYPDSDSDSDSELIG
jgi:hypothetical protein